MDVRVRANPHRDLPHSIAHRLSETALHGVGSRHRSGGIRRGAGISGCDAAARPSRKRSGETCAVRFGSRQALAICRVDLGSRAPQQTCADPDRARTQHKGCCNRPAIRDAARSDYVERNGIAHLRQQSEKAYAFGLRIGCMERATVSPLPRRPEPRSRLRQRLRELRQRS